MQHLTPILLVQAASFGKNFENPFYLNPATVKKKYGHIPSRCVKRRIYVILLTGKGGDKLGSVVKKRRKKMRRHKHRKLLAKTRHQRRKGK